jgi:RNA ligase (TIGR02306 family)
LSSTHSAEVFAVEDISPHSNADRLEVLKFSGYTSCVKKGDFKRGDLAVFIPPETLCSVSRPEFSFLAEKAKSDGKARIKAIKLRGVASFGLVIPAPAGAKVGDDVWDTLALEHYEPPVANERGQRLFMGGEAASGPSLYSPKYDLEAFRRYAHILTPGEPVILTEKVDGTSARTCWWDGQYHVGSRTEWKKEFPSYDHVTVPHLVSRGMEEGKAKEVVERLHAKPKQMNLWWEAFHRTESLQKFCRDNPGVIVYSELAGTTNCIKYGLPDGNRHFVFDLLKEGRWMGYREARELGKALNWVPEVAPLAYDFDRVCELSDGPTLVEGAKPGTIREGVVVSLPDERVHEKIGRVKLKSVSVSFLEKYR